MACFIFYMYYKFPGDTKRNKMFLVYRLQSISTTGRLQFDLGPSGTKSQTFLRAVIYIYMSQMEENTNSIHQYSI